MERPFAIPGGKPGYYLTCLLGLIGCTVTLWVGFIPPTESINIGGTAHYRMVFSLGILLMLLPAALIYLRKRHITKSKALNAPV
ncbi:putative glutamate/gamma-aminobutyrate antiporter [Legionella pneumophila]|nr:putative glutamate/gamma-aminobutyrate antiporter [Legionella pneumophila]